MMKFRCTAYRIPPGPDNTEEFPAAGHGISQVKNFLECVLNGLWSGEVHTITIERIDEAPHGK
jgi:hypothetical protein